ncbi:TrkA family potassium uptake protein [Acetobacterium fimetarium]|uniref:Trk system potassium uptake protein TrkA n=1 Tax=Acetobacterium fimetarium TaxID=52691 RepID=A0ABR6WVF1_9FIRM|nr:TrkA family potassium uptake protein [Acetobacterium fimetarium]MBC3804506.1 TrkA family potassium uptake protein [Acetobacterium fimetarium]
MNVIIVGGGRVGEYLATLLLSAGHRVQLIEIRPHQVAILEQDFPKETVILGSGTDPAVLEAAGIRTADVVAVVTGADEINLVAATIARLEYQVPRVVARVKNPKNAWLFTPKMGVDVALNQAELMASLVVEEMSVGDMMTLLKLNKGAFSLIEEKVHPASQAVGKEVNQLNLPEECILVAIIRNNKLIIPHGKTRLLSEDEVLAIVHASKIQDLAKILGPIK